MLDGLFGKGSYWKTPTDFVQIPKTVVPLGIDSFWSMAKCSHVSYLILTTLRDRERDMLTSRKDSGAFTKPQYMQANIDLTFLQAKVS